LAADRGYDSLAFRDWLKDRGIDPVIPHRYRPNLWSDRQRQIWLSRWKVERCFSWFNGFRRLNLRWEYYSRIHLAFLHLAAALICLRQLLQ
jgi:transposase